MQMHRTEFKNFTEISGWSMYASVCKQQPLALIKYDWYRIRTDDISCAFIQHYVNLDMLVGYITEF